MNTYEFYKMQLTADDCGLSVVTRTYVSIHETPRIHFCVEKGHMKTLVMRDGETKLQAAKRMGIKVRQIHKLGSRIAFETRQAALDNLRYLKRRQILHLQRQLQFNKAFVESVKSDVDLQQSFVGDWSTHHTVPGTQELVRQFIRFD